MRASLLTRVTYGLLQDVRVSKPNGRLFIIATPIGNMADLTPNILKKLFQADLIGCQDRRVAGQLYTLIKNKNIIGKVEERFGSLGLSAMVAMDEQDNKQSMPEGQTERKHKFYEYSHMTDRERRKFLGKLSRQEEKEFKIEYLKYRAKIIVNKSEEFLYQSKADKFDELYGIEVSDYKHIEAQILNTRAKKGRGLLIPLNTYSQTKMFDMVKNLLESKKVAIVSDAGMPCISDPGWKLVRMLRESMPEVPIEVVGGPSAIDIMLTLAKGTTDKQSLSGRFEGFASPQISNITEQSMVMDSNLQLAKEKDFSIHFINSKKLKKNVYSLEKIYGAEHRILLANQLTKKYQRKFSGSLAQLRGQVSKEDNQFEGIGQLSYMLYSDKQNIKQSKPQKQEPMIAKQQQVPRQTQQIMTVDVVDFVKSVQDETGIKAKQISQLVTSIFGVRGQKARKLSYQGMSKPSN